MFDAYEDRPESLMRELEDTMDGIFFRGQRLKIRVIPVYLAADDPRRAPMDLPEDYTPSSLELRFKKFISLSRCRVYRCAETGGRWHMTNKLRYVCIDNRNISIEVINPNEGELYVDHYILTSRKDAEDPGAQEFEYEVSDGGVTVTGVRHYCERLHIPAFLDGKPVTRVAIPSLRELIFLRELIMPDSVQSIDFYWELRDLEVIQIPERAVLDTPPDWINQYLWYRTQPEGPVYFQNYYCGTKGMPDARELIIRDGTLGSIMWTDFDRTWDAITFPPSFQHIGIGSFLFSADCKLAVPEECEEVKAHFARRCKTEPSTNRERGSR